MEKEKNEIKSETFKIKINKRFIDQLMKEKLEKYYNKRTEEYNYKLEKSYEIDLSDPIFWDEDQETLSLAKVYDLYKDICEEEEFYILNYIDENANEISLDVEQKPFYLTFNL